jgi:beta-glucosidase
MVSCWQQTIYEAIAEKIGPARIATSTGKGFDNKINYDAGALTAAASDVDAIILCLGENAYAESPGNTRELALPDDQLAQAKAAAATGKPVILVLTEGRPRFITSIEPSMKGILMAIEWKKICRSNCRCFVW